jgi:ADP-ribose pyrophosphatase YjhB (NUDIX family)
MAEPQWLTWARQIQAIAQTGLHYTDGAFDRERYQQLQALAAEIIATYTPDVDRETLTDLLANEQGYMTPKTDLRGVVFNDRDEILLVKELLDHGRWTLPGGWADVNTRPSENVAREVLEESGYRVRAVRMLAYHDRTRHGHPPTLFHIYKGYFLCELTHPDPIIPPHDQLESGGTGWFTTDALPPESEMSIGRIRRDHLLRFFEMRHDPTAAVWFD